MINRKKKGFTLVELLVVIAIIAIIAAVAVPVTIGQINKAKIGTAVDEANQVKTNVVNVITDLATAGTITATNLGTGLSEIYTEMKQCTDIYIYQAKTGDPLLITIVTGVTAPKTSDTTKGYIAADIVTKANVKGTIPQTGTNLTSVTADSKVAVQFKMKGTGVTVDGAAASTAAAIRVHWSGSAWAEKND